ncbi:MAG: T9SS type A sorting domain-containing protein [Bacteroidia bacterium]
MKKIYIMTLALFVAAVVSAQVTVTYKVDITNYLTGDGVELNENGMRIGGNFTTVGGALADGTAVSDWAPANAECAMTDEGDNVWSISVVYQADAIGTTQLFKFVNGDWGTNEGGETSGIATGGCGVDDGAGNINRELVVPSNNISLTYCYDSCSACDGSDALVSMNEIKSVENLSVFPNPTTDVTTFKYTLNNENRVVISVFDMLGKEVATVFNGNLSAGTYQVDAELNTLENGVYTYQMRIGEEVTTGQILKQ